MSDVPKAVSRIEGCARLYRDWRALTLHNMLTVKEGIPLIPPMQAT